jgi:serine protease Do
MKKLITLLMVLALTFTLASCIDTRTQLPYQSPVDYEQQRIEMISEVSQSVVVVKTETGHGSGIIYHKDEALDLYYVMTNHHVVEDGGEMSVYFGEGIDEIPVQDVTSNSLYDVAIVRFQSELDFPVYYSSIIEEQVVIQVIAGQDVYAIGTPQEIEKFNYVTSGIISMTTYPYNGVEGLAMMHDAELNPGNSGGPLFNLKGEWIGVNVAKVPSISTSTGVIAAEGLNYSLSVNTLYDKFVQYVTEEDFVAVERRPRLGVTVQDVAVFLTDPENDPTLIPSDIEGVVIIGFDESRNAFKVLELYDVIIRMNGITITSITDIAAQLEGAEFGDEHEVTVLRKLGEEFVEVTVTILLS